MRLLAETLHNRFDETRESHERADRVFIFSHIIKERLSDGKLWVAWDSTADDGTPYEDQWIDPDWIIADGALDDWKAQPKCEIEYGRSLFTVANH